MAGIDPRLLIMMEEESKILKTLLRHNTEETDRRTRRELKELIRKQRQIMLEFKAILFLIAKDELKKGYAKLDKLHARLKNRNEKMEKSSE